MKKILIVEDEVIIASCLAMDLEANSFEVTGIAGDYDQAVSLYLKEKPDIILTDINLKQDKDGIDFVRWLNESNNDSKIVFLTGFADDGITKRLEQVRYDKLLQKPVEIDFLIEHIGEILDY